MTSSKTKIVAAFIGFTMILGAVAGVQTANAQAMSLSQLVDLFISLGIISADKAAAAKAAVGTSATTGTTSAPTPSLTWVRCCAWTRSRTCTLQKTQSRS
jgi:hypothetical protein